MLQRCIRAEQRKLRAAPIWAMFFVLPLLSAAYGTFNYLSNQGVLNEDWYSLWTQMTLFYSLFFFPAMVAVYAGYLWRLEHLGHNWNTLMTAPVPPLAVFAAKLVTVVKMMALTQLWVLVLFAVCGKLFAHLPGWPPLATVWYLLRAMAGGCVTACFQLILSMLIRSYAVPVIFALFGGIAGMLLPSTEASLCWPYALLQLGMNANHAEDRMGGMLVVYFAVCAVWLAVCLLVAQLLLTRRDVKAA